MKRNIQTILSISFTILMFILFFVFYLNGDHYRFQIAIAGVICGLIPLILDKVFKLHFTSPFILAYFAFLVASLCLGAMLKFYSLGWWDILLHFLSGSLTSFLAIDLMGKLSTDKSRSEMSAWFIFLFVLAFGVFGGVLWEIYEFSADQFLGTSTQGGGNFDTMTDLIADTTGALIIAYWIARRSKIK
ncbi:hypothetical protein [Bacillus sp. EAC]|uniref:hypothetical protein n=1 Tax=Bacillus sp. EAC TaxID=1978338 RepID=UPI000B4347D4|nr:hypothetical protein [Bacillus sp. EAC]